MGQVSSMDVKVQSGALTTAEKEGNKLGQIHCVDVSTYKDVEWIQQKRTKCTTTFPKEAAEKTEDVKNSLLFKKEITFLT